jgi:hypothetical protein
MNKIEAVRELAQGGLIARAVEPAAGEDAKDDAGHNHEGACLNCGTPLVGPHCHGCGQRGRVHRTLGAFFHDLLHGVLHFEGKVWHTLPLLALRPGELTRRYIDGERARFVSPMALFLFAVFLMFAVLQMVGLSAPDDLRPVEAADGRSLEQQLAGLRAGREGMADDNPAAPILDGQIAAVERRIAQTRDADGDVVLMEGEGSGRMTYRPTGIALLDHGIEKWRQNPTLMAYKLQANSYKFSWLLIPLSIPFVWLIFAWRRRFGPYDHAVFVTYSLCFMSLLFVTIAALGQVPWVSGGWLFLAAMLIPPAHIHKQLRGAYGLSRFSAAWRTMVLLVFITLVLLLFLNLLLVLGALG